MSNRSDKALLSLAARALRDELWQRHEGTTLRCHSHLYPFSTDTDGWACVVAHLNRSHPRLEIWLDHYTGVKDRRFWFGFYSPEKSPISFLISHAPTYLRPTREFSWSDIEKAKRSVWRLAKPLKSGEFGRFVFEQYTPRYFYYGAYDRISTNNKANVRLFVRRAASFFEDLVRALPHMKAAEYSQEVYPQFENRQVVRKHLYRERRSALADACKRRDKYRCRVCGIKFEEAYGSLGYLFAEAHHLVPLSKLKGQVERTPDDLVTVCANCHRMLHKMDGTEDDLPRLRRIVRKRKQKNQA